MRFGSGDQENACLNRCVFKIRQNANTDQPLVFQQNYSTHMCDGSLFYPTCWSVGEMGVYSFNSCMRGRNAAGIFPPSLPTEGKAEFLPVMKLLKRLEPCQKILW